MLAAHPFAEILSSKHGTVADVAAYALRHGFAVVLDKPGDKIPLCILSERRRVEADRLAVIGAAGGRGRPDLARHACGVAHALSGADAAVSVRTLLARLARRYGEGINIGIEPGASRLVVVDVDTDAENQAFRRWLAARGADVPAMTVRSPGKRGADGTMVHRDGGHYWFSLPAGVELVSGNAGGVLKLGDDVGMFSVVYAGRQVLIPPSVRAEGAYVYTGAPVTPCPDVLLQAIRDKQRVHETAVAERDRRPEAANAIDQWSATTPWSDLLAPDGWTDTGKIDNCGCPVWTAPGPHDNYKSATAHEVGCAVYDTSTGWAPLHIWTDNPPEPVLAVQPARIDPWIGPNDPHRPNNARTVTPLVYLALMNGVSLADQCRALGIPMGDQDSDTVPASGQPLDIPLPAVKAAHVDEFEAPGRLDQAAVDELDPVDTLLARFKSSADLRAEPPLAPLVDGVLDKETTFRVVGPSGHGKTFVTLDMAACLATGQPWHGHDTHADGPVVYVVAEGAGGFKRRLWAWEIEHHDGRPIPADRLVIVDWAVQIKDQEGWRLFRQALQRLCPSFVVLDTQARVTVGMEENSATDMGIAVARMDLIRTESPGCVVGTVHHTGHGMERGRGSSAPLGAVNTEILVSKGEDGTITVTNEKQKDDVEFEPITLTLRQVEIPDALDRPAAVIEHGDPFDVAPMVSPAALVELRHVPEHLGLWVYWGSLIRDTMHGLDEGWTQAKAEQLITGKRWRDRDITAEAKRGAWRDLRKNGWVVEHEEGKVGRWQMTESGCVDLDNRLEQTR